ncbi:exosome complex component RRP4 isoform X2 [Scyliorhinus canicula]|uniref:exosome complex component RRP4 isoform X2 n=1 Tax=Scyliorhinus canicula TaxID=7830 RepID=UPI0018F46C52|nr:exosome complex component RRP4 isoform X2 [Scyliorhinus canicula]
MAVDIRLATARKRVPLPADVGKHLVSPGDTITTDTGFMRGHGTYMEDEKLIASVAGAVERVNKLICVKPLQTRYNGEVGDVVVGRITEVQQKRWKVETNSRLDSVLLLSSVNLPGGELLGQGTVVQVSPSLVKRRKTHFHNLPCGAAIILGNNGYIWIYPIMEQKDDEAGGFVTNLEPVPLSDREVISRLRNCIIALNVHKMLLYDTSVLYCYEASLHQQIKDILKPEIMEEIVMETRQRLIDQEG